MRAQIDQKVADSRQRIVHHLAQKGAQAQALGESLVKIPNDEDYVFFRHDEAQGLQILFTGWGFENSLTPTSPKVVLTPGKKPQRQQLFFLITDHNALFHIDLQKNSAAGMVFPTACVMLDYSAGVSAAS